MKVRQPAVAGIFYEGTAPRLEAQLDACFRDAPLTERESWIGAVVPHAGLMYSGAVAATFYAKAELPPRLIILCPNHTGLGHAAAINREGVWRTPLGDAVVDRELAEALLAGTKRLGIDDAAHLREHSLEVQLPFLQRLSQSFTFVPICLGAPRYEVCEEIGQVIADVVAAAGGPVGIVASSDLNHYEDQETTLVKDGLAIEQIESLAPEELWRVVREKDISMCGIIPVTTMLIAAKRLGAARASLISHATSGDVSGDYQRVVGYASMMIQ